MKTLLNTFILGIFFSLSLQSCNDKELDIHDYRFSATLEVADNQGTQLIVGTPIRMKLKLLDVMERAEAMFDFKFSLGDSRGSIYIAPDTVLPNVLTSGEFIDNEQVFYYIPKNGGTQTIKFTVNNGEYFSAEAELTVTVNTGAAADFLAPVSIVTESPAIPLEGSISVNNPLDEDNYYDIVFNVLDGSQHLPSIVLNSPGETFEQTVQFGETLRILNGTGSKQINYKYYHTANTEGKTTIEMSLTDRYGNVEKRVYDFYYYVHIYVTVELFSDYTGYVENGTFKYHYVPSGSYNMTGIRIRLSDKLTGEFYNTSEDIVIKFNISYNGKNKSNYTSTQPKSVTSSLKDWYQLGPLFTQPLQYVYQYLYKTSSETPATAYFFTSPVKVYDVQITNTTSPGRSITVNNQAIWQARKEIPSIVGSGFTLVSEWTLTVE